MICRSNIYLFYALHIQQGQVGGASSPLNLLQGASGHPSPPPPKPPPPTSRPAESCLYISAPNQAVCPCTKPSLPAWLSFCYATLLVFLSHIVIKFLVPTLLRCRCRFPGPFYRSLAFFCFSLSLVKMSRIMSSVFPN
jgi:hypothetical protein